MSSSRAKGLNRHREETAITSTLEMGGCLSQRPDRFPPGKDHVPNVQEDGWFSGQVWTCILNLASTGICLPDRPARSNSLYRLSYRPSRLPSEILITINPTCCTLQRNSIKLGLYVFQPIHTNHRRTICTSLKVQKPLQSVISSFPLEVERDRGSSVVKVLCHKSEGRWFDSSWCHWNFSLT